MTYEEAMKLLEQQAGNKDGLISLSTISLEKSDDDRSRPSARIVDAYYEDGAFYIVTHVSSNKMKEIMINPEVAVCVIVENFTARGIGVNLGWVCDEKNTEIITKLRNTFAAWYYNANNEEDKGTCILKLQLTKGSWYDAHEGIGTEIDFINKTAKSSSK